MSLQRTGQGKELEFWPSWRGPIEVDFTLGVRLIRLRAQYVAKYHAFASRQARMTPVATLKPVFIRFIFHFSVTIIRMASQNLSNSVVGKKNVMSWRNVLIWEHLPGEGIEKLFIWPDKFSLLGGVILGKFWLVYWLMLRQLVRHIFTQISTKLSAIILRTGPER